MLSIYEVPESEDHAKVNEHLISDIALVKLKYLII